MQQQQQQNLCPRTLAERIITSGWIRRHTKKRDEDTDRKKKKKKKSEKLKPGKRATHYRVYLHATIQDKDFLKKESSLLLAFVVIN